MHRITDNDVANKLFKSSNIKFHFLQIQLTPSNKRDRRPNENLFALLSLASDARKIQKVADPVHFARKFHRDIELNLATA